MSCTVSIISLFVFMIIDSHCHLSHNDYDDVSSIIEKMNGKVELENNNGLIVKIFLKKFENNKIS